MLSSLRNLFLSDVDDAQDPHASLSQQIASLSIEDPALPGAFSQSSTHNLRRTSGQEDKTTGSPHGPLSPVQAQLAALSIEDPPLPGNLRTPVQENEVHTALESLETLFTAATITADMVDTPNHDKLFSSSAEFYERRSASFPATMQSLDFTSALNGIQALVQSKHSPAFRPGGKFSRRYIPRQSRSPSPHSTPEDKKVQQSKALLEKLDHQFNHYHARIFADDDFASLSTSTQCSRLDEATAWLQEGIESLDNLEKRIKRWDVREEESMGNRRQQLREQMRGLHGRICALYGPLVPEHPIKVDSDYLAHTDLSYKDQLNQVLALLAVICNMVIGLSIIECNFLVGVAIICAQLGMSTANSLYGSSLPYNFSPSQNELIANMPKNLPDALKMFNVDGRYDMYAACPSCNYTNKARPLKRNGFYDYPESCSNIVVGEDGPAPCGTKLLKQRRDGTVQPIKPYLVSSLPDYLACCLADPTYVEQSKQACDLAFATAQIGIEPNGVQDIFQADFLKDFKGPDGKLFVDRGDKVRLAFSMHVDFFNPDRLTHRGATKSIGVISCANLALHPSIRYLPEYMYMCVVPGPNEPPEDELDHYIRPVIEQFVRAWRPGFKISRTADLEFGAVIEAGIVLSVNDLPAARKVAGLHGHMSGFICSVCKLRGRTHIFNTDHSQWVHWNVDLLRQWATAYRDSRTLAERNAIFKDQGVRWSSFWLLEYWDPTRMLVIDAMHCILEGLVHYHCRHVLRLDASSPGSSMDGFEYAFDWPWIAYDHQSAPPELRLSDKQIPSVARVQQTLCLAIDGKEALPLDKVWKRLNNQGTLNALAFVAHTLELPKVLSNISPTIAALYAENAQTKKHGKPPFPNNHSAKTKNHFIALLLNWRLTQAHSCESFIIQTGTPETLAHIQTVIRETITPSWLSSVPKNFGEKKAGSIKADEWRILSSVYLPIALVILWGDDDGCAPSHDDSYSGHLLAALDHTMALFQATIIACRYNMTSARTLDYRKHLDFWIDNLRKLFPHTREGVARPNIHAAGHIYDFLLLFGPVMSWWCFPFERLIGALQKTNTNDHVGGALESTIVKTFARTGNIRRWLHRPDCPEAIQQLKILFDKCFIPANASSETAEFVPRKGAHRAYAKFDGVHFSPSTVHKGNASIIYRPTPNEAPVAGQIQLIENIFTAGQNTDMCLHVQPYERLSKSLYDPFVRFPYLQATTYSSTLRETKDTISLDDIVAHAACYDYSHGRTVVVNLSRD